YDIFDDPDNDDSELTFSLILNSNPELFDTVIVENHSLNILLALNQFGSAELTIEATDPNGASVSDNLSITVLPVNDPPFLETPPVELGNQDLLYDYNIVFTDPENQQITIDTLILPAWLTFENLDNGTARIFGTPREEQVGIEQSVSLFADSEQDSSDTVNFVINIQNVNDPPYFTSVEDTVVEVDDPYDYLITAEDPDKGDVLTFSAEMLDGADSFLTFQNNPDGTAVIYGKFPSGTIGLYDIIIWVKDLALDSVKQDYTLRVKKANKLPVVSPFPITTDEDIPYVFTLNDFETHFSDQDGDTIQNIKIVSIPLKGSLSLNGLILGAGDTINYHDISNFTYIPKENDSGIDFFQWNAFDGTDYALIPANINIDIIEINDLPEILNFEKTSILFEFGNAEGAQITEGTVFDGDSRDRIEKAVISFKENYIKGEDSIFYDNVNLTDLTYFWEDSAGVLTISGLENTTIYTEAITLLRYVNTRP
ncbi:MAG: hypothetical protein KAQ79_08980, partial [Cyclobacteriaceae bacterium]|nr:hypothetical protein [Cyclobacteriaceae bacterium]